MTPPNRRSARLPNSIRALGHRNFRFYFAGQAISVLGSWIQQVAMSWLVYRLTGSTALLGITAFCALIPQLFIGPLAGAWIDKQDKRKWLIVIQGLLALQGFTLAVLTATGLINPTFLVAMALTLGVLNSFDTPLRQSLIGSFVGRREDLGNALALNAMLFSIGRSIGPPIAGFLISLTSEAACFAVNGVSFLALMAGVAAAKIEVPQRATGSIRDVFSEGIHYAWRTWPVRTLIVTLIALNLTASTYAVLLPVFASDVFGGNASTLGLLWGAAGVGAFASTVTLAMRQTDRGVVAGVLTGITIACAATIAFSLSHSLPIAMLAMAGIGAGNSVTNVGINMLLQSMAPETLRGRVISFFTSTRFGFDAVGGLIAGFVATRLGASHTLLGEGILLLCYVAFLATRRTRLLDAVAARQPGHGN
jgi:MFS family permease